MNPAGFWGYEVHASLILDYLWKVKKLTRNKLMNRFALQW